MRGDLVVSLNDCPVEDHASWTACLGDMYGKRGVVCDDGVVHLGSLTVEARDDYAGRDDSLADVPGANPGFCVPRKLLEGALGAGPAAGQCFLLC